MLTKEQRQELRDKATRRPDLIPPSTTILSLLDQIEVLDKALEYALYRRDKDLCIAAARKELGK